MAISRERRILMNTIFLIIFSIMFSNVKCETENKNTLYCDTQNKCINKKFSEKQLLELIVSSIKSLEGERKYFNQETYYHENEIINTSSGYILFKEDEERKKYVKMFYNSPDNTVIIAKHGAIIYYDRELKETSKTKILSSPLGFIFYNSEETLKKQIKILSYKIQMNRIYISISKKEFEDEYGYIELIFDLHNFQLIGWIIHSSIPGVSNEFNSNNDKKIEIKFISKESKKIELSEFNKFES